MASGDLVMLITDVVAPSSDGAAPEQRIGASTPTEIFTMWAFLDSATNYLDFKFWLSPRYAGGGFTLLVPWLALAATTGVARWEAAIRRIADDAEDLDVSHSYDYNVVNATTASAAGEIAYDSILFTDGADSDGIVAGEWGWLRLRRVPGDSNDTMGETIFLFDAPIGKET